jgi:hypothetical protein
MKTRFTMTMKTAGVHLLILLAMALSFPGCGGGGVTGGSGIDGSGLVYGPIEGFGSILVGGFKIDVSAANVTLDGAAATEADLRLGMIVTAFGIFDRTNGVGVADRVTFEDEVEGPVSEIDRDNSRFVVLGQTVVIDAQTVFEDGSFSSLMISDIVEVSGFRNASEEILATRVEVEEADEGFELKGRIRELDNDAKTFVLAGQPVDFSLARISGGPLANDLVVEVQTERPLVDGVLIADEIEVEDDDGGEGDEVEVEGIVTSLISSTTSSIIFTLDSNRTVRVNNRTQFSNGSSSDIVVEARLKVSGILDQDGILVADEIEFDEDEDEDDEN